MGYGPVFAGLQNGQGRGGREFQGLNSMLFAGTTWVQSPLKPQRFESLIQLNFFLVSPDAERFENHRECSETHISLFILFSP